MAKMDEGTKLVLLNLLTNLREATENTYYSYEMAARTHAALVRLIPEFADEYGKDGPVSFVELARWRADQTQQLDAAILLVESL